MKTRIPPQHAVAPRAERPIAAPGAIVRAGARALLLSGEQRDSGLDLAAHTTRGRPGDFGTAAPAHPAFALSAIAIHAPVLQPKLAAGAANDALEREADSFAEQVMRMPRPGTGAAPAPTPALDMIRPMGAAPVPDQRIGGSAGRPLDGRLRPQMESYLGRDLGQVRLHTGVEAARSARGLNSRAYTIGTNIVFESGAFSPESTEGVGLLAHELAHVVQQAGGGARAPGRPALTGAPAGRVQRQPKAPAKSADEMLADRIDHHPAWGSWQGGTGSAEGYQEIEAQFIHGEGEGSFYRSREFQVWYMSGWRGLRALDQPMKALQYVAAILIPNAKDRKKLFDDIQAASGGSAAAPVAGSLGASTAKLDAARAAGTTYDPGAFIEELGTAVELDRAQATRSFERVDFDILARGRVVESGMAGLQSFERYTIDGIEVSAAELTRTINDELSAGRTIPQVSKDFDWTAVDSRAGAMPVQPGMAKAGQIPRVAHGAVASITYQTADGRKLRREFWLRVDPNADQSKGSRMLRVVWSQWMAPEGLPPDDPSAMMMYGAWVAGRMAPGGGFGGSTPSRPGKGQNAKSPGKSDQKGKAPADETNAASAPSKAVAQAPRAILPGGRSIPPDSYSGGYHGTDTPPETVTTSGLPARGNNWDLQNHAEELWHYQPAGKQVNDSAFRGTTTVPSDPANQSGAAYVAGEGGYVYEIRGVPTWDVNKSLQGRVGGTGSYRGNLMHGEGEYAIPAEVPADKVVRWGVVKSDQTGRLYVEWSAAKK